MGPHTLRFFTVLGAILTAGAAGFKSLATINPLLNDFIRDICLMGASGLLAYLGVKLPSLMPTPVPAKGDKP